MTWTHSVLISPMASKLVLLCGYYGYGNGGDEALLATLIQMLPTDVTPVVMTATPAKTANQHHVATCDRANILKVLLLMFKAKGFIWGGGSLIQDSTSWISPLFYIAWMSLAQLLRLKTVAWAQGIGPLNRPVIKAIAHRSFKGCTARSTRDTGSAMVLKQWNLDYELAPDPVWALDSVPVEGLWDLPAPRVAVALRHYRTILIINPANQDGPKTRRKRERVRNKCDTLLNAFHSGIDYF